MQYLDDYDVAMKEGEGIVITDGDSYWPVYPVRYCEERSHTDPLAKTYMDEFGDE